MLTIKYNNNKIDIGDINEKKVLWCINGLEKEKYKHSIDGSRSKTDWKNIYNQRIL